MACLASKESKLRKLHSILFYYWVASFGGIEFKNRHEMRGSMLFFQLLILHVLHFMYPMLALMLQQRTSPLYKMKNKSHSSHAHSTQHTHIVHKNGYFRKCANLIFSRCIINSSPSIYAGDSCTNVSIYVWCFIYDTFGWIQFYRIGNPILMIKLFIIRIEYTGKFRKKNQITLEIISLFSLPRCHQWKNLCTHKLDVWLLNSTECHAISLEILCGYSLLCAQTK